MQTVITLSNTTNSKIIEVFDQEPSTSAISSFEIRVRAVLDPTTVDTPWFHSIEISPLCRTEYNNRIVNIANSINLQTDISLRVKAVKIAAEAVLATINANTFDYIPASWNWSINV